jgi:hypothetical protein
MGYGVDIMTGAVTPSPPLDQIVTVLDGILTRTACALDLAALD